MGWLNLGSVSDFGYLNMFEVLKGRLVVVVIRLGVGFKIVGSLKCFLIFLVRGCVVEVEIADGWTNVYYGDLLVSNKKWIAVQSQQLVAVIAFFEPVSVKFVIPISPRLRV